MDKKHEFNGFGCSADDMSPQLTWSNIPEGTKVSRSRHMILMHQ